MSAGMYRIPVLLRSLRVGKMIFAHPSSIRQFTMQTAIQINGPRIRDIIDLGPSQNSEPSETESELTEESEVSRKKMLHEQDGVIG